MNIGMVYGGGSIGLMGLVSQAVHDGGRHVIGSLGELPSLIHSLISLSPPSLRCPNSPSPLFLRHCTTLAVPPASVSPPTAPPPIVDSLQEEHFISKLYFSWPQVACSYQCPVRGSTIIFVSYKDCAGQVSGKKKRSLTPCIGNWRGTRSPGDWECFLHYLGCLLEDDSRWYKSSSSNIIHPTKFEDYKLLHLTEEVGLIHVYQMRQLLCKHYWERLVLIP